MVDGSEVPEPSTSLPAIAISELLFSRSNAAMEIANLQPTIYVRIHKPYALMKILALLRTPLQA
jgi:hypothetical protein